MIIDALRADGDMFRPGATRMLPVGDGHELYVEEFGDGAGQPIVFLHGGPGSGCQPSHRSLFDQARHRAILFDQRGAGRSTPSRSRAANTTDHLIADMEAIREAFGIDRWLVVGGSWGATLALAYAERYPRRVTGLVLRATFLGTRAELDRAFGPTLHAAYPDLFQDFLDVLPVGERHQPLDNYWRRILDPDPSVHRSVARAWHDTERTLSVLRPAATRLDLARLDDVAGALPSSPFMEAHYFTNDCFLGPDELIHRAAALDGIPGIIVQGRHDLLCPLSTAETLTACWKDSALQVVEDAGHALNEPGIEVAVRDAIARLASRR